MALRVGTPRVRTQDKVVALPATVEVTVKLRSTSGRSRARIQYVDSSAKVDFEGPSKIVGPVTEIGTQQVTITQAITLVKAPHANPILAAIAVLVDEIDEAGQEIPGTTVPNVVQIGISSAAP